MPLTLAQQERLLFITRVVQKEWRYLERTCQRLFSVPFTVARAQDLAENIELSEQLEAFTSRFCRLQDTIGDKWIPLVLETMDERKRTQIENVDTAERLGWLPSAEDWYAMRLLRNQMVHEYIEDLAILTGAVNHAYRYMGTLQSVIEKISSELKG